MKNLLKTFFSLKNINRSENFLYKLNIKDENKNFYLKNEEYEEQLNFENKNYNKFLKNYFEEDKFKFYEEKFNSYSIKNSYNCEEKIGDYIYYDKFYYLNNNNYVKIYRYKENNKNNKEIVFDSYKDLNYNKNDNLQIIEIIPNENGNKIGFIIDLKNDEFYKLFIKDLKTNKILGQKINKCYKIVFDDNDNIFYLKQNNNHRPYKLMFHKLGTSQLNDKLIYEEIEEKFYLDIYLSKSKEFIFLNSSSRINNKIEIIEKNDKNLKLKKINLNDSKITLIDHTKNGLIIILNDEEIYLINDFKYKLKLSDHSYKDADIFSFMNPKLIYKIEKNFGVNEIDIFNDNLIIYSSKAFSPKIIHLDLKKEEKINEFTLNNGFGSIIPAANLNSDSKYVNFYYENLFSYNNIYKYYFDNKEIEFVNKTEFNGKKIKEKNYEISYIEVNNSKGEKIPMTFIYNKRKNIFKPKNYSKIIIYNYGCYGVNNIPSFSFLNWELLENDYILCYTHIRGGNDLGKEWYYSAIKNKSLTCNDYLTCIKFIISSGISHPSLIFAESNSAGASIWMNVVNSRPELFKGVILNSPYLDILGLSDKNFSLSELDYDEFGNPENLKELYDIYDFCPYINIKKQNYPSILINAYEEDYRTPLWSILKFTKRLRGKIIKNDLVENFCDNNLLVKISKGSHLGKSKLDEKNRDLLFNLYFFEFLLENSNDINIKFKINL